MANIGLPRWCSGICWSMQKFKGFRFDPWVRKIPWRKKWQPTSVFLLGNFHGQSMGSQTIRHYWATDHACTHTWLQLLFRCLVVSDSLQPLGLQHARFPCPSLSPGVCSKSCPLSQWCHLTISSSAVPFSFSFSLSQYQGLFQWVSSLHQVARELELQL